MTGGREPLSRAAILRTAVAFADEHGLTALTMRRLGQELGVEAMSLYHHVDGREDLLEGMVACIAREVAVPRAQEPGSAGGWQAFLQHMAHEVRGVATAHPNLFPLVATRPPTAPWLRPPLRSLQLVEDFLNGLLQRGLDDTATVHVYKVFTSFLLGHLLLEVAQLGARTGPADEPLDEGDAEVSRSDLRPGDATEGDDLDLAGCSTVLRLKGALQAHEADTDFEQSLEALLDRLDRELSQ